MSTLTRCDILAQEDVVDAVAGLLSVETPFGWEEESLPTGETRFRVHCAERAFMEALADKIRAVLPGSVEADLAEVPDANWALAWREYFTPIACGSRFLVLPPWLRESADTANRTPIIIDPGSAFGTGHHATTALCLTALSQLMDAGRVRAGMNFLDLGTGSGILGLGCCLSGLSGLGADIDPLAVKNAWDNCALNGVENFTILRGGVETARGMSFDLALANILAQPLRELAPELTRLLRPGGCLVLSGILEIQADAVEAAYRAEGLPSARRLADGDWIALIWD